MCLNPAVFFLIPNHCKTKEMCIKGVEVDPWQLYYVPDHFRTQEMYDDAMWGDPFSLQFVPDWFVTKEQVKLWHDYDDYHDDDKNVRPIKQK